MLQPHDGKSGEPSFFKFDQISHDCKQGGSRVKASGNKNYRYGGFMKGKMQDWPLLVSKLIDHAAVNHPNVEIITATVEGLEHCYRYIDLHLRSKKLGQALLKWGMVEGDRIGTLAWNTYRHMEAWYGISGVGGVTHTINPRLFTEQISYIANHAGDRILMLDLSFVPLIEGLQDQLTTIEAFIIMTDRSHMPETSLKNVICYEEFVEAEDGDLTWPDLDENAAAGLCYTSGTTGNPKGVLYSHRSNVLHTYAALMVDALAVGGRDVIMPVVPMFHANAWGIPYLATACGAKLILNGPNFDGATLHELITRHDVTMTAGVPTVWLMLLNHLEETGGDLAKVTKVGIGGSAAPRSMIQTFQDKYGVEVHHAWGMTETSPLGTVATMTHETESWSAEKRLDLQCKQGRTVFGVELKIVDDDNNEMPKDGKAFGHLMVRGPWVVESYYGDDGGTILDDDGWFNTGDVATIDAQGYMQITDRSKDVIKSGGEWISSIDLENIAVGHPDVAEAAVIGIAHPKWDERPLMIIVPRENAQIEKADIMTFLRGKVAKWWEPNDVVFVDELPHTATGKILKTELRISYEDYRFPED